MASTSTISSKGQVTVPVEVRRRLGLKEGDRVEFAFVEGTAVLRPVRTEENPFEKWIGALAKDTREGTAVEWVREMRNDEFGGPGDESDV
jgi:AbrB family looped-hinge helix DNA binding protein